MDKPLISIIVPVYNTENQLKYCIESLINQTYKNIEIVCINDGSTDNSPEILRNYVQKDKRIVLINQENKGVSCARNAGIEKAEGEYILFVDSDDYLEESACKKLINKVIETNADIITFNYKIKFPEYVKEMNTTIHKNKEFPIQDWSFVNKLYKNEFLIKKGIKFPEGLKIAEDIIFIHSILCNNPIIDFLDDYLYVYCLGRTDSATDKKAELISEHIKSYQYFIQNPIYEKASEELKIYIKDIWLRSLFASYCLIPDKNIIKESDKQIDNILKNLRSDTNFISIKKTIGYKRLNNRVVTKLFKSLRDNCLKFLYKFKLKRSCNGK